MGPYFAIGLAMVLVGIGLRTWAIHSLGRYFTVQVKTSADQPVITTGPYHFVRHPSYTGIELILLGFALLYGTWIGLVAMAVLPIAPLVYRIRVEERALEG